MTISFLQATKAAHAGGALPFLAYRLSEIAQENRVTSLTAEEVMEDLRSLYYDVALSTTPAVFAMLKETVGVDRLLFGSDIPLRRAEHIVPTLAVIQHYDGFSAGERTLMLSGNAQKLFPRFFN